MSRIEKAFTQAKAEGRRALIPYITAGYPDLATTEELIVALGDAGATTIEVGVPFSDPMADGPVIQRACEIALKGGVTLKRVLETIAAAQRRTSVPVVLFSYLNPLLQYGLEKLAEDCQRAGVAGVLVTDLPADAAAPFASELRKRDLDLIFLVAPTSTDERLELVSKSASGFLYAVSRTGVTGTQNDISMDARALVKRIKQFSSLPVALGFGISTPDHAREALEYADAVVVGSALVRQLDSASSVGKAAAFLKTFTHSAAVAASEK